jgi:hypothetical protein
MATKAKPKSNRAKFTLGSKKAEKPKEKAEAPKKEKKVEVAEESKEEVVTTAPQEEGIIEKHPVSAAPEITHQSEVSAPEQPTTEAPTSTETPTPELPTNPFSVTMPTMPEHPLPETHENPFVSATPLTNETHPSDQTTDQPIQQTPLENSELSSTLPKEDPLPHQSSFSTPVEVETNNKGKGIVIYFIIVAFIAFLVGIGSMALFTFGFGKMNGGVPHMSLFHFMAKATPTPIKTTKMTSPTPMPTKAVDLTAYNIKILNGSGVNGAASKLKTELTTDGFTVVSAGNADKSDYTDTIIAVKKDLNADYLNKLKEVLKKEFNLGQDAQLSDTDAKEADVTITIGSSPAK